MSAAVSTWQAKKCAKNRARFSLIVENRRRREMRCRPKIIVGPFIMMPLRRRHNSFCLFPFSTLAYWPYLFVLTTLPPQYSGNEGSLQLFRRALDAEQTLLVFVRVSLSWFSIFYYYNFVFFDGIRYTWPSSIGSKSRITQCAFAAS